jgi:hypothetical protein
VPRTGRASFLKRLLASAAAMTIVLVMAVLYFATVFSPAYYSENAVKNVLSRCAAIFSTAFLPGVALGAAVAVTLTVMGSRNVRGEVAAIVATAAVTVATALRSLLWLTSIINAGMFPLINLAATACAFVHWLDSKLVRNRYLCGSGGGHHKEILKN